jgi:hypothetical protein
MNLLRDGRTSDYFTVEFPRETHDRVQDVTIVLRVPTAAGNFVLDKPTDAEAQAEDLGSTMADGRMLSQHEILEFESEAGAAYSVLAWRSQDVAQSGGVVTTAIRKKAVSSRATAS